MPKSVVKINQLLFISFLYLFQLCFTQYDMNAVNNAIDYDDADRRVPFSHSTISINFLTPLIEKKLIEEAQKKSSSDAMGLTSYSGFLEVRPNSNIFFWFFPAQQSWENAALVMVIGGLQGGPGVSSLYAIFEQTGPFKVNDNVNIAHRINRWMNTANVLFVDRAVGPGFGFSDKNFFHDNGTAAGNDLYEALLQFYQLFPNLQKNKLVIAGECYAVNYVPVLADIIRSNNSTATIKIKLTGLMLLNPWSDPLVLSNHGEYLFINGLIEKEVEWELEDLHKELIQAVKLNLPTAANYLYKEIVKIVDKNMGKESPYVNFKSKNNIGDVFVDFSKNNTEWQNEAPQFAKRSDCKDNIEDKERLVDVINPLIGKLLEHYPVLLYHDKLDVLCSHPRINNLALSLDWTGRKQFQGTIEEKWCIRGNYSGNVKQAGNLYQVLVLNAAGQPPVVPINLPVVNVLESVISSVLSDGWLYELRNGEKNNSLPCSEGTIIFKKHNYLTQPNLV